MAITQPSSSSPLLPGPGSQTRSTDAGGGLTAAPTAGLNGAFQFLFNGSLQALQQEQTEAGTGSPLPPAGENLPPSAGSAPPRPDSSESLPPPEMPLPSAGGEGLSETTDREEATEESDTATGQMQASPVDTDSLEAAGDRGVVAGTVPTEPMRPQPGEGEVGNPVPPPAGKDAEYPAASQSRENTDGKQASQTARSDMSAGQLAAAPQTGVQQPVQPGPEQTGSENARHPGSAADLQQMSGASRSITGQMQASPVDTDSLEAAGDRGVVAGTVPTEPMRPQPGEGEVGNPVPPPAGRDAEYPAASQSRENTDGKQASQTARSDMSAGQLSAAPQAGMQQPMQPGPEQTGSENARHPGSAADLQQMSGASRSMESSAGALSSGQPEAEHSLAGSAQAEDRQSAARGDEKHAAQPASAGEQRRESMTLAGSQASEAESQAEIPPAEAARAQMRDRTAQEGPSQPAANLTRQLKPESVQEGAQPAVAGTRPGLDPASGRTPMDAVAGRIEQMLQSSASQEQSANHGDDREAPSRQQEPQAQPVSAARSGSGSSLSAPPFTLAPRTLLTPNWGRGVGERAIMMAQHGPRVAHIQLDPPELGAMQIRIHMHGGDQVSVSFSSPNPAVRDALEQQLPRLREMFADQGLNLQDLSVSDQPSGRHSGQQQQAGAGGTGRPYGQGEDLSADGTLPLSPAPIGLVDYYA